MHIFTVTMDITKLLKWVNYATLAMVLYIQYAFALNSMEYLLKYGYFGKTNIRAGNLVKHEFLTKAVSDFQKFAGLPITGEIDNVTSHTMSLPRCGVTDQRPTGLYANNRRKRFALHGSKWPKRVILYRITQYSRKIPTDGIQRELQRAFDLWSEFIPLTFVRRDYGPVDISIKFVKLHHRDNTPFDGSGQTLAHAYFPQYGGDAHFDEDEHWTVNVNEGVNLFQVAAHEFGHSLGLAHSSVKLALMAPFYRGYDQNFKLDMDDILAVQELYGTKDEPEFVSSAPFLWTSQQPTTPTSGVDIPDICLNATIDAITRIDNGDTYIFKDEYYYRLNEQGIEKGYPRKIQGDWGTVDGPIDAALTWPNGWTFIFKGSHYWKFHNLDMKYGPKNISEGFDGVPSHISTAFVWSGNGKTYFVKDDKYWRYYGNRIDYGYPRDWNIWRGLPKSINAAFQWKNGRTYFFSGDKYYKYDDQIFHVDTGGYPRDIARWWLGCPEKSNILAYDRQPSKHGSDVQWITVDTVTSRDVSAHVDCQTCSADSVNTHSYFILTLCILKYLSWS